MNELDAMIQSLLAQRNDIVIQQIELKAKKQSIDDFINLLTAFKATLPQPTPTIMPRQKPTVKVIPQPVYDEPSAPDETEESVDEAEDATEDETVEAEIEETDNSDEDDAEEAEEPEEPKKGILAKAIEKATGPNTAEPKLQKKITLIEPKKPIVNASLNTGSPDKKLRLSLAKRKDASK